MIAQPDDMMESLAIAARATRDQIIKEALQVNYRELEVSHYEIRSQPTEQQAVDYVKELLEKAGFDLDRPMERQDLRYKDAAIYRQEA